RTRRWNWPTRLNRMSQWEPTNADVLFQDLLAAVPEFKVEFDEHLKDNEELLPYVLMDDFSSWLLLKYDLEECDAGGPNYDIFRRGIGFLNRAYSAYGERVRVMINTTFCESVEILWREPERLNAILRLLSPELRASCNVGWRSV